MHRPRSGLLEAESEVGIQENLIDCWRPLGQGEGVRQAGRDRDGSPVRVWPQVKSGLDLTLGGLWSITCMTELPPRSVNYQLLPVGGAQPPRGVHLWAKWLDSVQVNFPGKVAWL